MTAKQYAEPMKPRGLIFDLDGTLINSEEPEYASYANIYAQHGQELALELWGKGVGTWGGFDPQAHLEELLVDSKPDWEKIMPIHRAEVLAKIAKSGPLLGVRETLHWAETKFGLALASSSGREWVEDWLTRFELQQFFSAIKTRDDVREVKPAPDLFLAASQALGLMPEDCLAIEDSPNGARAALAAGMQVIVIPSLVTNNLEFPGAAKKIKNLLELQDIL